MEREKVKGVHSRMVMLIMKDNGKKVNQMEKGVYM